MELFWRLQARETPSPPRQTQRRCNITLTQTAKPFLQHCADNQKVLAAGGGEEEEVVLEVGVGGAGAKS